MQVINELSNTEVETGLADMNDLSSIFQRLEESGRRSGGGLEASKASWRRHDEAEVRLMV